MCCFSVVNEVMSQKPKQTYTVKKFHHRLGGASFRAGHRAFPVLKMIHD
jgi:hypothetical protein